MCPPSEETRALTEAASSKVTNQPRLTWGLSGGPCGPQCVSEGSQGRQGQRGWAAMPSGQQGPPGVSGRVATGPSPSFKQENQSGHGWLVRETFNGLGMCTLWLC